MRSIICVVLLSASALVASAQKSSVTAEADFYDAIPTVVKLPVPAYPGQAEKSGLSGVVSVKITVDETGKVTSADDADGPYPLCKSVTDLKVLAMRTAAIEAAKKAKFKPTIINSTSTTVTGFIRYDFRSSESNAAGGLSTAGSQEMRLDRVTKLGSSGETAGARVVNSIPDEKDSKLSEDGLPKTVSGGVLNGKAATLTKPAYPAAARAVRAVGAVSVQVLIVEDGSVFSAAAITGHPLLRRSSEIAACGSRFMPTLLNGDPVKVSGVITYNYVP